MDIQSSDVLLTDNIDRVVSLGSSPDSYVILLYCASGRITLNLDGRELLIQSNDFLVCSYMTSLGDYMRSSNFSCMAICVASHTFEQLAVECFRGEPRWLEKQRYIRENPVFSLSEEQIGLMQSYATLFTMHMQAELRGYSLSIMRHLAQAATLDILSYLDDAIADEAGSDDSKGTSKADLLLLRFMELLHQCSKQHHDVNWYARQLCITPKYLSRVCKMRSGRTALQWIDDVMIEEIRRLLLHTDMTVKEVAFASGFNNVSFFCQYVRSRTGKTPMQLRKNNADA